MIKAIAIAVAALLSLSLWLLKRYFSRGDTLRRLKRERRKIRNEMVKAYTNNDLELWHVLHDKLQLINHKINLRIAK